MKVLNVLYELKFSGAEIMYVDAAPFFQKKGCELSVVSTAPDLGEYASYFERSGYRVFHKPHPSSKKYISRIKYYKDFIRFLKKENYDVVHIHSNSIMWEMALCARLAGKRSVYTFHSVFASHFYSYPYHLWKRWSAKKIFRCKFQTISNSVYDNELNRYHNKTKKIYNWYGNNRFYPALADEKKVKRDELGIPEDALVLISVGGCNSVKRHSEIIKALPHIIQNYPNVLYLHLGKGETEAEEKKMVNDLGLSEYVRFCNNQADIRKYMIASDIYLMPSKHEGISITTIEAMACSIPAILYNVPGLRDFNSTGENSLLIPEDHKILAEKVIYLHQNPAISLKLSENARELVKTTYHLEKNAAEIYQLYL